MWTWQTLPKGRKAIGCRWLFRIKDLPDGGQKYKARQVAKGYAQVKGLCWTVGWALADGTDGVVVVTLGGRDSIASSL